MSSCASYVLRTHYLTDDVSRLQSRSNFKVAISLSKFPQEHRSKAQNKSLWRPQNGGNFEYCETLNTASI